METVSPIVTVLMTVRNGAVWLEQALRCLWAQKLTDFEVVVIDDGSIDGTAEILSRSKDERLRAFILGSVGRARALNAGLAAARGRYVAIQDVDDLSSPRRLQVEVDYLEQHPEIGLVGTGADLIDRQGRKIGSTVPAPSHTEIVRGLTSLRKTMAHSTVMFRTSCMRECGGYRQLFTKAVDFDLLLRLSERITFGSIPDRLCQIRESLNTMTFDVDGGDQWEWALLAFVSAHARRVDGVDPLEGEGRDYFVARFRKWYKSSHYPRAFRAAYLRREGKLAIRSGQKAWALRAMGLALALYPQWALRRVHLWPAGWETREAVRWVVAELHSRSGTQRQ